MMSDVRKGRNHLTSWIHPAIKKDLEAYFNNDEGFKRRRLTNVANRALPKSSKYTGGSVTFMKTKSKLLLDCEVTLVKTFKYTHTLKANKERFADKRSATHYDYTQRLVAATQQSQPPSENDEADSKTSVVDPDRIWCETAPEPHKKCHFSLGSFFASSLLFSALAAFSASATSPANPQEIVDLREDVQKLTQELHRVAISSDLTKKLEQLDRLREQMGPHNQQMHAVANGTRGSDTAGSSGNAAGGEPTSDPTPPPQ
ncbi:hypothetical protein Ahy_B05g075795 [Arachis hypogaea]|uniref:Uncharacterized protein n=1 Tax=Arachis hypogaea TaxID=3818 RepID=A0A444Z1Z7_ARAHY|nr:hypothetical protein Ahy_B05g075795 [Arachis hypogaea]